MSLDVQFSEAVDHDASDGDYRALSVAAVTSLALGFLSACALLTIYLAIVPIAGILFGLYAAVQINKRPSELTGRGVATTGIVLSAVLPHMSMRPKYRRDTSGFFIPSCNLKRVKLVRKYPRWLKH
jgi:hypothetical protein